MSSDVHKKTSVQPWQRLKYVFEPPNQANIGTNSHIFRTPSMMIRRTWVIHLSSNKSSVLFLRPNSSRPPSHIYTAQIRRSKIPKRTEYRFLCLEHYLLNLNLNYEMSCPAK